MCLAIYKPANSTVSEDHLTCGWRHNPGGAGFAYVHKNKVEISKGFMKLQEFLEAYREAVHKNKKSPFLIHFRIPSMGHSGPDNTHPFQFKYGALIHNGTMYGTGASHGVGKSDTAMFAERYGDRLTYETVEKYKEDMNEALSYNKVVLLYHDSRYQILNEKEGVWLKGAWFSNKFFLPADERAALT